MESRLIEQNRILLYTIKNREDRQDTQEIAFKKKKKGTRIWYSYNWKGNDDRRCWMWLSLLKLVNDE